MKKFRAVGAILDEDGDAIDTVGPFYGDTEAQARRLAEEADPDVTVVSVYREHRGDWTHLNDTRT